MHTSASQYIRLNLKKPTYKQLEQKISALEAALAKAAQTHTVAPELDEYSEDYQQLFENMNTGFVLFKVVFNAQQHPVDLIIVAANKAFGKTTGLCVADVLGKKLTQVLPGIEHDEANWIGTYGHIAKTGESKQFENTSELLGYHYNVSAWQTRFGYCAVTFLDITARVKAEHKLKESENKYANLYENSPEMHISIDAKTGTIINCNQTVVLKTGYTKETLIGQPIFNLYHPSCLAAAKKAFTNFKTNGEVKNTELLLQKKDGGSIDVILNAIAVYATNGAMLFSNSILTDITEKKRIESKLAWSNKLFEHIFKHSPLATALLQLNNMHIQDVNPAWEQLFGYTRLEVIDTPMQQLALCESEEAQQQLFKKIQQSKRVKGDEFVFKTKLGAKGNATFYAEKIHYLDTGYLLLKFVDITEKRNVEKELNINKNVIENIVNISPDIFYIYDIEEQKNIFVSNGIQSNLGYNQQEIKEMGAALISILMHPDDFNSYLQHTYPCYFEKADGEFVMHEYRMRDKSGQWHWLYSKELIFKRKADGTPKQIFGYTIDITDRKQYEQEISEKNYLLSESQRIAHVGSYIWNMITGAIQWSDECYRLYGVQPETFEVTAESGITCIHPDDQAKATAWVRDLLAGKPSYPVTYRTVWPDGSMHWLITNGYVYTDAKGNPIKMIGTIQDISERLKMNEELRLSEEKFQSAFHISPVGVTINKISNGEFLEVNSAFLEMFEFTREEVIGHTSTELTMMLPEERKKLIEQQLQWGGLRDYELIFQTKSGKPLYTLFSSRPITIADEACHITVIIDITERKRAVEKLKESEARFREIYEQSPLAIQYYDVDGNLIDVNPATLKLFGIDDKNSIKPYNFWNEQKLTTKLANKLKSGQPIVFSSTTDFDLIKKLALFETNKTGIIYVTMYVAPIISQDKTVNYLVHVIDVSERKKAELEIKELNTALEKKVLERTQQLQDLNSELQSFTYSVSHDLKAPLRGIDGYSNLLLELHSQNLEEEAQTFIKNIRMGTKQMNQLIDDLLLYSRLERSEIKPTAIRIKALINELIDTFNVDITNRNILISNTVDDILIYTDLNGLSMAIRNVLENAIKFTRHQAHPTIEISSEQTAHEITLLFKDNGIGFDMKFHHKIFEIFQRLHRVEDFPGTGIGLALVSKSIRKIGGTVWAESKPHKETTFYFKFPKKLKL